MLSSLSCFHLQQIELKFMLAVDLPTASTCSLDWYELIETFKYGPSIYLKRIEHHSLSFILWCHWIANSMLWFIQNEMDDDDDDVVTWITLKKLFFYQREIEKSSIKLRGYCYIKVLYHFVMSYFPMQYKYYVKIPKMSLRHLRIELFYPLIEGNTINYMFDVSKMERNGIDRERKSSIK